MDFPDMAKIGPFDANDPNDLTSEAARKAIVGTLGDLIADAPDDDACEAVITGALVGLVGVSFCLINERSHRAMVQSISDALPAAANYARDIMNLPPLKDS